ncbi:MAG: hypothetical protein JXB48_03195 [Candidatus Latescibacteria bacterium]|nr:hypothetical protein [Candidatus Latescibacterota bacterium]
MSEPLSQDRAETFIKSLIHEDINLDSYADPQEHLTANRLGIRYEGVHHKFLISYDIDDNIKRRIRNNQLSYTVKVIELRDTYSKLEFRLPDQNYRRDFYFKGNYLIYYFNNKDTLLIVTDNNFSHYHSKQFYETFKNREYNG